MSGASRRAIDALGKLWRKHASSLPPEAKQLVGAALARCRPASLDQHSARVEDVPATHSDSVLASQRRVDKLISNLKQMLDDALPFVVHVFHLTRAGRFLPLSRLLLLVGHDKCIIVFLSLRRPLL